MAKAGVKTKVAAVSVAPSLARPVLNGAHYGKGRATVSVAAPMARISLRAPDASIAALNKALGFALPKKAKTSASNDGVHALWLGPDEWLLLAPANSDLFTKFAKVAAFHSAVDISQRNAGLVVKGAGAADVINAGCPQDLSLATFPVGACSRTIMGKTEIVLFRMAADAFHIEVWRSFAPYAFDFLEDAIKRDC
jgi:sarcosine oxidase, subunit gamma